jgi:hypothetical protein
MLRATKKKLGPIILYTKLPSEAIYIYIYIMSLTTKVDCTSSD